MFMGSQNHRLIRVLKGLHIRTVMRPHQTLKQRLEYVHPKDVIPDMEKS